MTNAIRYLDALKAHMGVTSDYRIAQILGVTKGAVSRWRHEQDSFSIPTAEKVAKALDIDPAEVVLSAQIDRAKTPEERAVWEGILKKCGGLSAALLLALGLAGSPAPAEAVPRSLCIMSNRRRILRKVNLCCFAEFFGYHRRRRCFQ